MALYSSSTGLILGHAAGDAARSLSGYRHAAVDARRRIEAGIFAGAIWAERLERSQIVPGGDIDRIRAAMLAIGEKLGGAPPQLAGEKAVGRYIREHVGLKLGPIRFHPAHTGSTAPVPHVTGGEPIGAEDAYSRVEIEVAAHNAARLAAISHEGAARPAASSLRLLTLMAGA